MKQYFFLAAIVCGLASCTSVTPLTATSNNVGAKCGTATETRILGVFPFAGDHGIDTAAKNGGIKKISHVDVEYFSVLGYLYTKTTTKVYGE